VKTAVILTCLALHAAWALDPHKSLTQYSHKVWTQQDGLPQDTIRSVTQTSDGYLWIGTDEGLARFDGYEFTTFDKPHGDLPSNSITALAAAVVALNGDKDHAAESMRTIGFVPDWQASPDVQQDVRSVLSMPAGVRSFLNNYIKAANK